MISSFKIKGFKQFQEIEISNLSRITLLGGKNSSGKTSILEGLFLFYHRGDARVLFQQLEFRGITAVGLSKDSIWLPIFNKFNLKQNIEVEISDGKSQEKMVIKHNKNYVHKAIISSIPITDLQNQTKNVQQTHTSNSLDFKYFVGDNKIGETHLILDRGNISMEMDSLIPSAFSQQKVTIIPSSGNKNINDIAVKFGEIDIRGETNLIVDIIKIIEPRLKSLSTIAQGNQSNIYGDIGLGKKIPVQYMGEGAAKLLSIIVLIAANKDGVILIDEIENGFHHSVLNKILKAIYKTACTFNCQIIATTHSYELLENLASIINNKNKNDFCYVRLDWKKDKSIPKTYTGDMLKTAIAKDWEVR
ncbi:MAG: hypothetical protein B6I26_03180 [Desulfobacteraceae bacterium 4572_130]|nr:MAG: hypothetical protein B6I26_03180 [Desulfobacteraceae bacterium 4572_130]